MKIRTNELTGAALDWAVAKASQPVYSDTALVVAVRGGYDGIGNFHKPFSPSTDWAQGGPIVEREHIGLSWVVSNYLHVTGCWSAHIPQTNGKLFYASTPLIAAMRCYIASKLGDEVEVPEELTCSPIPKNG